MVDGIVLVGPLIEADPEVATPIKVESRDIIDNIESTLSMKDNIHTKSSLTLQARADKIVTDSGYWPLAIIATG